MITFEKLDATLILISPNKSNLYYTVMALYILFCVVSFHFSLVYFILLFLNSICMFLNHLVFLLRLALMPFMKCVNILTGLNIHVTAALMATKGNQSCLVQCDVSIAY